MSDSLKTTVSPVRVDPATKEVLSYASGVQVERMPAVVEGIQVDAVLAGSVHLLLHRPEDFLLEEGFAPRLKGSVQFAVDLLRRQDVGRVVEVEVQAFHSWGEAQRREVVGQLGLVAR